MAVEHQSDGAVGRLSSPSDDVERTVPITVALAGQSEFWREKLHPGEADHAVGAALQPRLNPGKPSREAGEEAVVEATDPRLAGSDDPGALAVRPWNHRQFGLDVHDAEA